MTTVQNRSAGSGSEAPLTLDQAPVRALRLTDQLGMWANLGVSILGFTGAIYVLNPLGTGNISVAAAALAIVVGTVLGTAGVAAAAVPGARTGQPSMVLLRGLFGTKPSYLPTVLNIVQLLGWTVFELVTIGTAMHQITPSVPRWAFVLAGGIVTTALALRPLGFIRTLRKYVTGAVVVAMVYLLVQLLRHPFPDLTHGGWNGFWIAVDTVVGVSVSWVPLVSDYSRHAHSSRQAFWGTFAGYTITQIACYGMGLLALITVAKGDADKIFGSFLAVPLGTIAFGIIVIRELDQSFADTYSTAISTQNLAPHLDRRWLALFFGVLATAGALWLNIGDYETFLVLIGSVFTPMLGVLIVDYFWLRRGAWDLGEDSAPRWRTLAAWIVGFAVYQLINPGSIGWWSRMWGHVASWLHFTPQTWMSASLLSFAAAALVTVLLGMDPRTRRPTSVLGERGLPEAP